MLLLPAVIGLIFSLQSMFIRSQFLVLCSFVIYILHLFFFLVYPYWMIEKFIKFKLLLIDDYSDIDFY